MMRTRRGSLARSGGLPSAPSAVAARLRTRARAAASALVLVACTPVVGTGAGGGGGDPHASLYSGLEEAPAADLTLRPEGERKAEALAKFFRGRQRETEGDFRGALELYRETLALDAENISLAGRVADMLARFGEFKEAVEVLEQSLAKNEDEPGAYLNLSRYCDRYHNGSETIRAKGLDYAKKAVERFPRHLPAYANLIYLHLQNADRAEAAAALKSALDQNVDDPGFWLALGKIAQDVWPVRAGDDRAGNLKTVTRIYERALEAGEDADTETTETVADFFAGTAQYERAETLYRDIIGAHPEALDAREKLAKILRFQDRHAEASAVYEELVAINPYDPRIRTVLADYFAEQEGSKAKAVEHLLEAIKLGDNEPTQYLRAVALLWDLKRLDEAVAVLKRAEFMYPDDPRVPLQLGMIYQDQQRYPEAFEMYEKTEAIGEALVSTDWRDQFLNEGFYFSYAAVAERSKQFERAAELFRKSIDLVPDDTPELAAKSYNYLGYMWLEQNMNLDEAGELIKLANELAPDNGAYLDSLGWFHFVKGEYEAALKPLLRAAELLEASEEPDGGADPVVLDHIAQTYFKLGNRDEAVRHLQRALELEGATDEMAERLQEYQEAPEGKSPEAEAEDGPGTAAGKPGS